MMSNSKIKKQHLTRLAIVYVRQSTLAQVRGNQESTARQYGLAEEAKLLGWDPDRILVIDADQGISGRSAAGRQGFQDLVHKVCLNEAGAIFGLEVSRLARNSADLQRLLEFCSLTETLIVDADGVYDLQDFNDRLLLGLKGTMSEAELHILAGRLQESKRAAARCGRLRFPLPVGYVYDDDGRTVMDPSEEIRAAVAEVFSAFDVAGSAYGVVGRLAGRPFPTRAYGGSWAGKIRWGTLTHGRALQILTNPTYAGAYVYGRRHAQRSLNPDGSVQTKTQAVSRQEWAVNIPDHHPGYVSWEVFLATEARLAANSTNAGAKPPREGNALLQGMVLCGSCGHAMSTIYPAGTPGYACCDTRTDRRQKPGCRFVTAKVVDAVVVERVLAVISTEEIRLALVAAGEVQVREANRDRGFKLQVERARYEAERAERAFDACEPENRLVARTLEHRWEEKLKDLSEAEAAWARAQIAAKPLPPREELEALVADFTHLFAASSTSCKDRKRILRTLVADVTLLSEPAPGEGIRVGIHWKSGAFEEQIVNRVIPYRRCTPPAAVELVRHLSDESNEEIARKLAAAGLSTGRGRPFDAVAVKNVRSKYQIPSHELHLAQDEWSVSAIAANLGVRLGAVYQWIVAKDLDGQRDADGRLRVSFPPEVQAVFQKRVANSRHLKRQTEKPVMGEAV